LGVPEEVPITSPTFVLIHEHIEGRLPVYHMDLYRLGDPCELYELGLWEYYDGEGVCLVEWCDRFDDLWPQRALVIAIGLGQDEARSLELSGADRGAALCQALAEALPELILSP
jgi:tRNA threonylcarbamoyladenosine biosynthesis protein TsaE